MRSSANGATVAAGLAALRGRSVVVALGRVVGGVVGGVVGACVGIAVLATIGMIAPSIARAQEESPRETAERVQREGSYPTDISVYVPEPTEGEGSGTDAQGRDGRGRGSRGETSIDPNREAAAPPARFDIPFLREFLSWLSTLLGSVAGPLGWVLFALAGSLLVMLIVFFVARMRWATPRLEAQAAGEREEGGAVDPLLMGTGEAAEALAAQGRFREAIHALFLESLERVGGTEGRQRARTARELVSSVDARRAGRAELGALLDLTELVWFGGRDASEAQYRSARALRDAVLATGREEAA